MRHDGAQDACWTRITGCGISSRDKMSHSQTASTALCCPPVERFRCCSTRRVAREEGTQLEVSR